MMPSEIAHLIVFVNSSLSIPSCQASVSWPRRSPLGRRSPSCHVYLYWAASLPLETRVCFPGRQSPSCRPSLLPRRSLLCRQSPSCHAGLFSGRQFPSCHVGLSRAVKKFPSLFTQVSLRPSGVPLDTRVSPGPSGVPLDIRAVSYTHLTLPTSSTV